MRPQYYRQYSFDCLQLANTTSDPDIKAVLVEMALPCQWDRVD